MSPHDLPSYFLRENSDGRIIISDKHYGTLEIVAVPPLYAKAVNALSFKVAGTNKYLRHQDFFLKAHNLEDSLSFHLDATFVKRQPLISDYERTSFEALNLKEGFLLLTKIKL